MSATNNFYIIGKIEEIKRLDYKNPLTILVVREMGNDKFEPCEIKCNDYTKNLNEAKVGQSIIVGGYVSNYRNEKGYTNLSLNATAMTVIADNLLAPVEPSTTNQVDVEEDDLPF